MTHVTDTPARARRSGIQSIEIGGAVLEAMVRIGAPATLSAIANAAGLPSAKAHRYLTSLCEIGLTRQDVAAGRYGLGPLALRLGLSAIAQTDILERAFEVLGTLCNKLRISGHLSVWSEAGPVVIRSAHGGPPVISPVAVGTVLPLQRSASGLIYLSYMPSSATVDELMTQEGPERMAQSELDDQRRKTRKAGFALASGNYIPGLCAIALPILNHDETLAGAITLVSTNTSLFTESSAATNDALDMMDKFERGWSLKVSTGPALRT